MPDSGHHLIHHIVIPAFVVFNAAAAIAKEALKTGKKVKDLVLGYGLMDEKSLEKVLNPYEMT